MPASPTVIGYPAGEAEDGADVMAHDTNESTTDPQSDPRGARLSLAAGTAHRGALDGGWWPRSHDARTELPELVAGLAGHLGRVTHLAVDTDHWEHVPGDITVAGRKVKVGGLPGLGHVVVVIRGRMDTFLLLVVPPEAAQARAYAALSGSAAGAAGTWPEQILATCDISTA
ncbi:DUF5994 family protein [Actinomadura keratinilytica]|jgi:hypothetical protein|uniref:Uncharacterized protein n=1 Tax=Actinomadura keratinilytica TaxID=547461 RepID=A0ABP7Y0F4_9ACTN